MINDLEKEYIKTKIDLCLERLETDKINEIMELLGWEWWDCGVPGVATIEKFASDLLWDAWEGKSKISSGGLMAEWYQEEGVWQCQVSFVLTESNTCSYYACDDEDEVPITEDDISELNNDFISKLYDSSNKNSDNDYELN